MISCTKLLCGMGTIGEEMNYSAESESVSAHMLHFSEVDKPVVAWNITQRCNLRCLHCYISAEDVDYSGELTTEQAKALIDDLADVKIPVLLMSGGEPLLRKDVFELGAYAIEKGIRAVLSSNGTVITPEIAKKIHDTGFSYVGISIDGGPETHDHFRQRKGCFDLAIQGIRNCTAAGVRAGVRLTLNKFNYKDLPEVLDIVEREGIPRFCMYHLVYSGRGKELIAEDVTHEESQKAIDLIIDRVLEWDKRGIDTEVLTTDNHADGIVIEKYIKKHLPDRQEEIVQLQRRHGGCSAGKKFANIDAQGNVHPCQFWGHVTLGNVKEHKFSEIWNNPDNDFLQKLKNLPDNLVGERCGKCVYKQVCGGCRVRAEAVYDDIWADDPACYLTDADVYGR